MKRSTGSTRSARIFHTRLHFARNHHCVRAPFNANTSLARFFWFVQTSKRASLRLLLIQRTAFRSTLALRKKSPLRPSTIQRQHLSRPFLLVRTNFQESILAIAVDPANSVSEHVHTANLPRKKLDNRRNANRAPHPPMQCWRGAPRLSIPRQSISKNQH